MKNTPQDDAVESQLTVFIVDDDAFDRERLAILLGRCGYRIRLFPSAEAFMEECDESMIGCVLADLRLPGMSGIELLDAVRARGTGIPFLVVSGFGDVNSVRDVFHKGAVDFLEKPLQTRDLFDGVEKCFTQERQRIAADLADSARSGLLGALTDRERQVAALAAKGNTNREVGEILGISHRTVEVHKSRIMSKLGIRSTAELIRVATASGIADRDGDPASPDTPPKS